jgi:hypothetical protein
MTCAIPVRQTNNAIYYVDQEAINVVTADYLNPIIDNFESKIAEEHSLIGNESDVNNSGNFSVYLTPAVNRLGANQGGFVTGFYFGGDLFPAANTPASNQREIFYSSVPDPNGTWGVVMDKAFWASNIGPTVFPHEFQHMISFNQHVILRNSGAEEAWANEGFSHFFEDLDMNTHFDRVGLENPSRVALFLSSPENSPFTGGTSISQRGGSYLFFRYLYEQANLGRYPGIASGDDLLRQLIDSDMKGVENIQNVTNTDFKDLLLNFYTTLQISNSGVNLDPTYNFKGINIRAAQNDNRGTVLKGVTTHPFTTAQNSGSVSSPGGLFYDASGSNITSAGQTLNFVGATGMEPGGAVIRLH